MPPIYRIQASDGCLDAHEVNQRTLFAVPHCQLVCRLQFGGGEKSRLWRPTGIVSYFEQPGEVVFGEYRVDGTPDNVEPFRALLVVEPDTAVSFDNGDRVTAHFFPPCKIRSACRDTASPSDWSCGWFSRWPTTSRAFAAATRADAGALSSAAIDRKTVAGSTVDRSTPASAVLLAARRVGRPTFFVRLAIESPRFLNFWEFSPRAHAVRMPSHAVPFPFAPGKAETGIPVVAAPARWGCRIVLNSGEIKEHR
jgi:hypothetical protein